MSAAQDLAETYRGARSRLMGPLPKREPTPTLFSPAPGRGLPRNGTSTFYRKARASVEFSYAMQLVCDDRGITPDQILNSPYCAAVAARHMLWTVMLDGGYAVSDIARKFVVDHKTVTLGIASFRQFQQGRT